MNNKFSVFVVFAFVFVFAGTAEAQKTQEQAWVVDARVGVVDARVRVMEDSSPIREGKSELYLGLGLGYALVQAQAQGHFALGGELGYAVPLEGGGMGVHLLPKLSASLVLVESDFGRLHLDAEGGVGVNFARLTGTDPFRVKPEVVFRVGTGYGAGPVVVTPMVGVHLQEPAVMPAFTAQLAARCHF